MSKVKSWSGQEIKIIPYLSKQAAQPNFLIDSENMELVQDLEGTLRNIPDSYHRKVVSY